MKRKLSAFDIYKFGKNGGCITVRHEPTASFIEHWMEVLGVKCQVCIDVNDYGDPKRNSCDITFAPATYSVVNRTYWPCYAR